VQRGPQPIAEVRTLEARGPVIGGDRPALFGIQTFTVNDDDETARAAASAFVWRRFQASKR